MLGVAVRVAVMVLVEVDTMNWFRVTTEVEVTISVEDMVASCVACSVEVMSVVS
jgi:hypothetical protein